uniref:CNH domain-containing protein n=1 Tax=Heterorhabditis bacteriophora TaxID=37862 RepID=A0A1I7X3S4_HETBA
MQLAEMHSNTKGYIRIGTQDNWSPNASSALSTLSTVSIGPSPSLRLPYCQTRPMDSSATIVIKIAERCLCVKGVDQTWRAISLYRTSGKFRYTWTDRLEDLRGVAFLSRGFASVLFPPPLREESGIILDASEAFGT